MSGLGDINFEKFKKEVCSRCDSIYDLKRRENILTNVLDSYHDELAIANDLELKYEIKFSESLIRSISIFDSLL